MSADPDRAGGVGDARMRAAIQSVLLCGLCLAVGGVAVGGLRAGAGVAVGGALATLNLLAFARIGQAFVSRRGNTATWSVLALLKVIVLFGGVFLILKTEVVSVLSLVAGYAALPVGITLASLFGPRPEDDGGNPAGS